VALELHDWKKEIEKQPNDPNVSISYVRLSAHGDNGLYSSIIPPGRSNTGHYHPNIGEYYHFVKGTGTLVTLTVDQLEKGANPNGQAVREGMSVYLPPLVIHRLFNNSNAPLTFLFECPLAHMDAVNPVRTLVPDFGSSLILPPPL
jgi:oxalate decarboxylase/phosphoglucose isomerase-like protein (cupin superfamily)